MDKKAEFDILPSKSNINSYNRYPFADYDDAVHNLLNKSLRPGEIAVAYYWDHNSVIGISSIIAVGNLRRGGNQIYKNAKQLEEIYFAMTHKVAEMQKQVDACVCSINTANKNYGFILGKTESTDEYARSLELKIDQVKWIDLDTYTDDL